MNKTKNNFINDLIKIGTLLKDNKLNTTIFINVLKPYYYILQNKKVKYKFLMYRLIQNIKNNKLTYNDLLLFKEFLIYL